jgi:hypothetical protein
MSISFPAKVYSSVALLVVVTQLAGCGPGAGPSIAGEPPGMRRISEEQYANIVEDLFGAGISVAGQPDPLPRTDGLLAVGALSAHITPSGFEHYYNLARTVSAQVVGPTHRGDLIPCVPESTVAADDACAEMFLSKAGRLLYRRPLTSDELDTALQAANEAAGISADFYDGLAISLAAMMTTPQFLFIIDTIESDPNDPDGVRLSAYAKAARLSFLLWNSTPDDMLLTAAETGVLDTQDGFREQAERMFTSPRLYGGVRSFFNDMLVFEKFETLEKDPTIYPAFSQRVAEDAREQLLLTITNHLLTEENDYRDLFTTRKTFVTPALARVYGIPAGRPGGGWSEYEFGEGDPRAGIITQIAFTALNSHPGKSSPTLRGKALRETLLCQKVPDPPDNVDFTLFNDPDAPNKTARERLKAHSVEPSCAGCHRITDPIGLGLEIFNGTGSLRTTENGVLIDTSGFIDGIPFAGPAELGAVVRDNPASTSCVVERLTAYAMARPLTRNDREFVDYLEETFADENYQFTDLLRRLALSDAMYAVSPPADELVVAEAPK